MTQPQITVRRPGSMFEEYFPNNKPTEDQYKTWGNLWWQVLCCKNIPPRDEMFEYELMMGYGHLEAVLEHKSLGDWGITKSGDGMHLTFYFPERHLSVQEQYLFVALLQNHPDIKNKKLCLVRMITSSPLIISNFRRDDVKVLSSPVYEKRLKLLEKLAEPKKANKPPKKKGKKASNRAEV